MDSRLIHESLDETESRWEFSAMGREVTSLCRMNECLRLAPFGGATWATWTLKGRCVAVALRGCDCDVGGPGVISPSWRWRKELYGNSSCGDALADAVLVPGRTRTPSYPGANFLLLVLGRGRSESGGWPKTKPAAAAATTVPVPTSCNQPPS